MEAATLIKIHYREIGVIPGWRRKRFHRLCAMLQATPEEIGLLVGAAPKQVDRWLKRDRVPTAESLLCAMLEAALVEMKIGHKTGNIIPVTLLQKSWPATHHD